MCGAFGPPPGHDKGTYGVHILHLKWLVPRLLSPCNRDYTSLFWCTAFNFKGDPGPGSMSPPAPQLGGGGRWTRRPIGREAPHWTPGPLDSGAPVLISTHSDLCTYSTTLPAAFATNGGPRVHGPQILIRAPGLTNLGDHVSPTTTMTLRMIYFTTL